MFCEKCGNKLNDTDKFCMKCGTPVRPEVPQPEEQAPVNSQPEEQAPVNPQPEEQAPVNSQPEQQPPVYPQAVQPAPKKPMSKGAKRAILFTCIGVAAVALFLILLFTVIIPALRPTFDPTKYLTMTLYDYDTQIVYDGNIEGEISVDIDKIREDYPNLLNDEEKEYTLEEILCCMTVSFEEKGNKNNADFGLGSAYFEGLKKKSALIVTTSWDSLLYSRKEMQDYAGNELGVKLICRDIKKEMKVADTVKENDIEIKAVTKLDILSYLRKNNLIITRQDEQKTYRVGIKPFNATINGITVSNEYFGSCVEVSRGDIENTVVSFDLPDEVKAGDKVKVQYSELNIFAEGGGLELTGDPFYYTAEAVEELNADTARKNAAAVKAYVTGHVDKLFEGAKDVEKITVSNIYFVTNKTFTDSTYLVVTYQNDKLKDYGTLVMTADGYFSDGKLVFEGDAHKETEGITLAEAEKGCSYLDTKNYDVTKI